MAIRATCKSCRNPLDCNSVQYCRYHLLKEREYDMRRRNGGLNPHKLSEDIRLNYNGLDIRIVDDLDE